MQVQQPLQHLKLHLQVAKVLQVRAIGIVLRCMP